MLHLFMGSLAQSYAASPEINFRG